MCRLYAFSGLEERKIDEKGRILLPKYFIRTLGCNTIKIQRQNGVLKSLVPIDVYDEEIKEISDYDEKIEFSLQHKDAYIDAQNRFVLLNRSEIGKENKCALVGLGDKIKVTIDKEEIENLTKKADRQLIKG